MPGKFVHLHTHSHYSLLDGLGKIDELLDRARELGMAALALTDHGALYGAVEFYKKARARGIKPIIGAEIYVAARRMQDREPGIDDRRYHLTILAKNFTGYQNLVALITKAHLEGFYYKPRVDHALLRQHAEGLIALSGCLSGEIPRAILAGNRQKAEETLREYLAIFGKENFYLELGAHPKIEEQIKVNRVLVELALRYGVGLVGSGDIHYTLKEDAEAQDILVSIQTVSKLDDENRLTMKQDDFSMKSQKEMADFFTDIPEAVENTVKIAEACNLALPLGVIQLPEFRVPDGYTANTYLHELCVKGLEKRYGMTAGDVRNNSNNITIPTNEVIQRLDYELSVIEKTGFASYFLVVQDFVNWAKSRGIVVGPGRGSAAGSIVSYLLGITNIDPLTYGLLFERFLNPERVSMPDIDLDFADHRRDEVIEYVRKKYGEDRVAQIITFGTMAARAVIRDAGRALAFPYSFCDRVAKMIPFGLTLKQALETTELRDAYEQENDVRRLVDASRKLEGVARHASTHACGVVITRDPLTNLIPLQHTSQDDRTVITQYEMHGIEDLGLLKMDFLGLRNLSIIEETVNLIKATYGQTIDVDALPLHDQKTFALLREADTTGVFQLEGGGMRRYLKELRPTELEDIIAMVALYRPGPMELIPQYIARKNGKEPVEYLHEKLKPILEKTYGIAVYQEQLMEIARTLAGFTYAEADILRKAVGKKIGKLLQEQRAKLMDGMRRNGIDERTVQKIWEWIEPFAQYGFNRSHSACYAMIGYQTAYLKAHYPYEFLCAILNAESGTVERVAVLVQECRKHAIPVLAPDINASGVNFTVEYSEATQQDSKTALQQSSGQARQQEPIAIRFGLAAIKNVGEAVVTKMVLEREGGGPFLSLADFLGRLDAQTLNKKTLESLIAAGALDQLGERNQMLQNIEELLRFAREQQRARSSSQGNLFGGNGGSALLKLKDVKPATGEERLRWEKELLGLYVTDHPLNAYRQVLEKLVSPITQLSPHLSGRRIRVGGIISKIKKIITKNGSPMLFVDVEDFTDRVEVVVFPSVLERNPTPFRESAIVLLEGRVNTRDGEVKFLCDHAEELVDATAR